MSCRYLFLCFGPKNELNLQLLFLKLLKTINSIDFCFLIFESKFRKKTLLSNNIFLNDFSFIQTETSALVLFCSCFWFTTRQTCSLGLKLHWLLQNKPRWQIHYVESSKYYILWPFCFITLPFRFRILSMTIFNIRNTKISVYVSFPPLKLQKRLFMDVLFYSILLNLFTYCMEKTLYAVYISILGLVFLNA